MTSDLETCQLKYKHISLQLVIITSLSDKKTSRFVLLNHSGHGIVTHDDEAEITNNYIGAVPNNVKM